MSRARAIELEEKSAESGRARAWQLLFDNRYQLIVILFAAIIYIGAIFSPPSLMDDVDAVQPQIARNMIHSGDWVTAHLDGVAYMEKAPLKYWLIAASMKIFGEHDWAARLPIAISAVLLCWIVALFGQWAFGRTAGMYAGICLATCVGLFLFTRILIPDCLLTLAIAITIFSMARLLEDDSARYWPLLFWIGLAVGALLKGLIGIVFPIGTAFVYLLVTRQFFQLRSWRKFRPGVGILLFLAIAAPWHILAIVRNPPIFDLTLHSESGSYRGFFWFYFINEQVLRFLNRRYPRDYNTVPRLYFWLFHLLWLFPWSFYLPSILRLDYRAQDRAARIRLLALCWLGVVLIFFSFSTTQEYYSMPCYPAFALLLGSALATPGRALRISAKIVSAIAAIGMVAIAIILYLVRSAPTPGDIASALTQNPEVYTLSLGHMSDLTLSAFAYLRLPLALAGLALAIGAFGGWRGSGQRAIFSFALMMVIFFHAARLAMVVFDPYLSSRPLAQALVQSPAGQLIVDDPYYEFSSVFFYADRDGLILNGRRNNLEYGSYAPHAANVFIDDNSFIERWRAPQRYYVVTEDGKVARLRALVGESSLYLIKASGGKRLFSNHPLD